MTALRQDPPLASVIPTLSDYLRKGKGLALGTVENYKYTLKGYIEKTGERLGYEPLVSDFNKENIRTYFYDHVDKLDDSTQGKIRSHLRCTAQWMMDESYIQYGPNPVDQAVPLKKTKKKRKTGQRFTDEEFQKLTTAATSPRDYFLFLFMRETGRRIGEVLGGLENPGLLWRDIDWEKGYYSFDNSKGRELGELGDLTSELRAILLAWKDVYETSLAINTGLDRVPVKGNWYVFPALIAADFNYANRETVMKPNPTKPITNGYRIIRDAMIKAGIREKGEKGRAWHRIRATLADAIHESAREQNLGDAWEHAASALGHKDSRTTRAYVNPDAIREHHSTFRKANSAWSPGLMAGIPELAGLVAERHPEELPAPVALPVVPVAEPETVRPALRLVR